MIGIVDYGMGNLRSVSKAMEHLGAEVLVSARAEELRKTDKMVLPGVGAFGDAMREIRYAGLEEVIRETLAAGKPFLGICLGLQLLFRASEESPGVDGLGILDGTVRHFEDPEVKVPHMGWNDFERRGSSRILDGVPEGSYFYFVHSYYAGAEPGIPAAGICSYGRVRFSAVLERDHIFATQFHPEKSQGAGLRILENFIAL